MKTTHKILNMNANAISCIPDNSLHLVVTSPPYPMIEMWDEQFASQDNTISDALHSGACYEAFEKMHRVLDEVWKECDRVLIDNGFVCINIGDATRTIDGSFALFSNHSRIIQSFLKMGYTVLPDIHWRKQSNAPNKFMGSGMYPAGAYVTYEHEYILIFRKGNKRVFNGDSKKARQESAYFWEERNVWFSDLWDIKGTSQQIAKKNAERTRNASFPFDIPYRLINMYSVKGDIILDPFCGMGTTTLACMAAQRNSIGVEISADITALAEEYINSRLADLNAVIDKRLSDHMAFIEELPTDKKEKCYINIPHGFFVKTRQETALHVERITDIRYSENGFECSYS